MNQDQVPIGLIGEENFYQFAFNTQELTDLLGLAGKRKNASDEVSGCASDSSKNEKHMDDGRAISKSQQDIARLRE